MISSHSCHMRISSRHYGCLLMAVFLLLRWIPVPVHGAVPESFTVRTLIGDTVVHEMVYRDDQLKEMTQSRQVYSGIDEEGLPCTIAAEGILLTDLAAEQGVKLEEIESIRINGNNQWTRSMIRNYLYGVNRSCYPHLSEAWKLEHPESAEDGMVPQTELTTEQIQELRGSDAIETAPLLALRTCSTELNDVPDWESLSAIEGYRFCFGQMNPSDGVYMMYGYNLQSLEIKVSANGDYAEQNDMQNADTNKPMVSGGADSAGSKDVAGPYENPFTGEISDQLPDELAVQVGYFGTGYETVKTFSFEELASMPLIRQAYSTVTGEKKRGIVTALGVRLVDIITASGIDIESVEKIAFCRTPNDEAAEVTLTKAWLLDMNRYYYPNLTASWNYTTGGKGAASSAVRTDTILAIKDHWDPDSTVPDFFNLVGTHRFHLVYGQTTARSNNVDKSMMWIGSIRLQLEGSPPQDNSAPEDGEKSTRISEQKSSGGNTSGSGRIASAGSTAAGSGIGRTGSAGSSDTVQSSGSKNTSDLSTGNPAASSEDDPAELSLPEDSLEQINTSGKHVYEISNSSGPDPSMVSNTQHNWLIAVGLAVTFLAGGGASVLGFRRRMKRS